MDHGREFNLVIFVQQLLLVYRNDESRESYKQTRSTKNYVAERFWPEVNMRINYPLKRVMNHIVKNEDLDISDKILKICFSWVMLYSSVVVYQLRRVNLTYQRDKFIPIPYCRYMSEVSKK